MFDKVCLKMRIWQKGALESQFPLTRVWGSVTAKQLSLTAHDPVSDSEGKASLKSLLTQYPSSQWLTPTFVVSATETILALKHLLYLENIKVKLFIHNQNNVSTSLCITLTLARSLMSLPDSCDPETPTARCMLSGAVQKRIPVTWILEHFVSEGKVLWKTKDLTVPLLRFQERKGRFKESHLQELPFRACLM